MYRLLQGHANVQYEYEYTEQFLYSVTTFIIFTFTDQFATAVVAWAHVTRFGIFKFIEIHRIHGKQISDWPKKAIRVHAIISIV